MTGGMGVDLSSTLCFGMGAWGGVRRKPFPVWSGSETFLLTARQSPTNNWKTNETFCAEPRPPQRTCGPNAPP